MKSLIFSLVLGLSAIASADVMFWQIGDPTINYEYACMRLENDGTIYGDNYVWHYAPNGAYGDAVEYTMPAIKMAADIGVLEDDYFGLSFVVELYDADDNLTHISRSYSFSDLQAYISSYTEFTTDWQSMNALKIGEFKPVAVPEPTSALLIVIGSSLLLLKRRA